VQRYRYRGVQIATPFNIDVEVADLDDLDEVAPDPCGCRELCGPDQRLYRRPTSRSRSAARAA
jgi:hypothetical protein